MTKRSGGRITFVDVGHKQRRSSRVYVLLEKRQIARLETSILINGGSVTLTASGGALQVGTNAATQANHSIITARQLNNLGGVVTMSGLAGLSLAPDGYDRRRHAQPHFHIQPGKS